MSNVPEKIVLYKDPDYNLPLSSNTWSQTIGFGQVDIPDEGYVITPPSPCYARNEGGTTLISVTIKPFYSALGIGGSDIVNDISIACDVQGNAGNFGNDGDEVTVVAGELLPYNQSPTSNTSQNISDPTVAPSISISNVSSNIARGVYSVSYSFVNLNGETLLSPSANLNVSSGDSIKVEPINLPTNAVSINYYMSYMAGFQNLYLAGNGNGAEITLIGAQGIFTVWIRQKVFSTNTPGKKQAQLLISATDIG